MKYLFFAFALCFTIQGNTQEVKAGFQKLKTMDTLLNLGFFPAKKLIGSYNFIYGRSAAIHYQMGSGNIIIGDTTCMVSILTDDNWIVNYHELPESIANKLKALSKTYKTFSRKERIEKVCRIFGILPY